MLGPGNTELIVILFIVLLLFGGRKLPELARSLGIAVQEFTKASKQPVSSIEKKENEEKEAILNAAKKLGINVEGKDINEIAKEIVNITENSVDLDAEYFSSLQLIKGNTKGIDLDKDGSTDVDLHLSDIKEDRAEFVIKQNNNKFSSIIYNLWWMILLAITIIIIIYASSRRSKAR